MKNPRMRSTLLSTGSHVKSALLLVSVELSSIKFDGRSRGTRTTTMDGVSQTHTSTM